MKLTFVFFEKTRRVELRAVIEDYAGRIGRFAEVQINELRVDSAATLRKVRIEPGATVILLDDGGKVRTSAQFAAWLAATRDQGARELVFLCGAAGGVPEPLRSAATQKLSLSSLTYSHELARVMLLEQVYRAFAILAGHPYPK